MKKAIFFLAAIALIATACDPQDDKQSQKITFGEIVPQNLRDSSLVLQATASSGLPVILESSDSSIAAIDGNTVFFKTTGTVSITAKQSGNSQYYEAPNITRSLIIRDIDPNKKTQTISFELPAEWQLSRDGTAIELKAAASSGLPVKYILSDTPYASFSSNGKLIYLIHGGEAGTPPEKYDTQISVTASQTGNDEYNPADNVTRTIHIIGDVIH
ncbi:MAG: hypothetical protein LBN27_13960 [Prevotellaceae bacterium]|nr:hypothetical protein [Prevotellaceae bacterium]